MIFKNSDDLFKNTGLSLKADKVIVKDIKLFRQAVIDDIVDTIILSDDRELKSLCYWISYQVAIDHGIIPASIQSLYEAWGEANLTGFTVPAINLRVFAFDSARAVFRAASKIKAGAFIFEIAASEIEYTNQSPMEYASMIFLAAIKEGYQGALFLQGDHYQIDPKKFKLNREQELERIRELIKESINASFFNIDIDSSTLSDFTQHNVDNQERLNYEICAYFTKYIRQLQPKDIDISIGGEIGELSTKNSTEEELHAFMRGYKKDIGNIKGVSKLSIQTGATHGGVILPDGSIAKVNIDFETLQKLSEIIHKQYNLAGCVQQGASTLPQEAFHKFPNVAIEIHLATQFQNLVYDYFPLSLKEKIYAWIEENCQSENNSDWTRGQFIYRLRKDALGPFKRQIYSLPTDIKNKIAQVLEKEFSFLFEQLNIKNTKKLVDKYISLKKIEKTKEDFVIKS